MKTCRKCGIEKDETLFPPKGAKCKACVSEYMKAYHEANRARVGAQKKAYRDANKDAIAARDKAYREANREKAAAYSKAYREANKVKLSVQKKAYREANKDAIAARDKAYREAKRGGRVSTRKVLSKEERAARKRTSAAEWYAANRDAVKRRVYLNKTKRLASDPFFAFKECLRTHARRALGGFNKDTRTEQLLGLPFEDFHAIWESRCEAAGITDAVIDHIVPLAAAKTKTEAELMSHWSNLQPLTAEENSEKSDNMTPAIERRCEELRAVAWLLDALN